jgi:fucose permease
LAFAFSAPRLNHRFGPRCTLTAANLLVAAAAAGIAVAASLRTWVPLMVALFAAGAGLALPYATAPRLALSTLPADRAGTGAGVINACTFLGGSIGVAAGAVAFSLRGLPGTAGMIALLGLWGAWLSCGLNADRG